jgi:hypothetical protein
MKNTGHDEKAIADLVFRNAMAFYGKSPNWTPVFDLVPENPAESPR